MLTDEAHKLNLNDYEKKAINELADFSMETHYEFMKIARTKMNARIAQVIEEDIINQPRFKKYAFENPKYIVQVYLLTLFEDGIENPMHNSFLNINTYKGYEFYKDKLGV